MTAAEKIRGRIAELRCIRDNYLAYQEDRVSERDHHGAWDVAVNLSETECEISGLQFALEAVEADEPGPPAREDDGPVHAVADEFKAVSKGSYAVGLPPSGAPVDFLLASSRAGDEMLVSIPALAMYLRRMDRARAFGWVLEKRKSRP